MGLWGYGDIRLMGYRANEAKPLRAKLIQDVFLIGRSLIGVKVSCPDSPEKYWICKLHYYLIS